MVAKPYIHSVSSAKRWGGKPEDYLDIHVLLDSSKGTIADNRHRALTHNSWFIFTIIPRIFGETFVNSAGRVVSSRDVAEQHVLEDYAGRFIPSAQDWLELLEPRNWFDNAASGVPSSYRKVNEAMKLKRDKPKATTGD